MKILNTADWHLNIKKNVIWNDKWSRREEQEKNILSLIDIAKKEKIDYFNILGDIFDTSKPASEDIGFFILVLNELEKAKIKTVIIQGNHDIGLNENVLMNAIKKIDYEYITVIDPFEPVNIYDSDSNANLFYIPFFTGVNYKTIFEKKFILNSKQNNLVFIHDVFTKAAMGSEQFIIKGKMNNIDEFNNKIDCVFAGHIHRQQNVNDLTYYPGAVSPMSFNEEKDKQGYIIAEIDKKDISVKFFQFKNMKWKTLEIDNDKKLPALTKYKNCLLRIKLQIKQKDKKGFDKNSYIENIENKTGSKVLKFEFKIKEINKQKEINIKSKETPIQQFSKYIKSKDFTQAEIKKIEKELNKILGEM